jgi:phosphohistidine phosphatase
MKLYVLRHAEAEEGVPGVEDGARRLTARGKARIRDAAKGLRRLGVTFDMLLTSPLARAAETAAIVAAVYNDEPRPQVLADLATGVASAQLVTAMVPVSQHGDLMVVGHEPQLSELVSLLLTGSPDSVHSQIRKGGCVALEMPGRLDRYDGQLLWMLTQRQLRKLG